MVVMNMIFNRTAAVMRNQKAMFKIQQMYFFTYFLSFFSWLTCIRVSFFISVFYRLLQLGVKVISVVTSIRVHCVLWILICMLCSKGRFISIRKVCWNFKNNGNVCEYFLITYITVITVIENRIRTNIIFKKIF